MLNYDDSVLREKAKEELLQMTSGERQAAGSLLADTLTYSPLAGFSDIEEDSMELTKGFLKSVLSSAFATYLKVHNVQTGDLKGRKHEGHHVVDAAIEKVFETLEEYIAEQGWTREQPSTKVDPSLN